MHRWKYDFECSIRAAQFLNWAKDELRTVTVVQTKAIPGKARGRKVRTTYEIPAAYHRIVCQLALEIRHAEMDLGHEAVRRRVYARKVLDNFGRELESRGSTPAEATTFRSVVLTPILQRQLWGVPDSYTPMVQKAIENFCSDVTIQAVTKFYLQQDPTDPTHIPAYRRRILYVPTARWHLGRVMGNPTEPTDEAEIQYYNKILADHDLIIEELEKEGITAFEVDGTPFFTEAEKSAISEEGLGLFFAEDLTRQASRFPKCLPVVARLITEEKDYRRGCYI